MLTMLTWTHWYVTEFKTHSAVYCEAPRLWRSAFGNIP